MRSGRTGRCRAHWNNYSTGSVYVPSLPFPTNLDLVCADTEIDWETYMIQIEVYLKGERDYSQIYGPTGPLVLRVLRSFSHKRVLTWSM